MLMKRMPTVQIITLRHEAIQVDESTSLKRMLPAPQGRAYRMRKRSNHVSLVVDRAPNEVAEAKA